MLGLKGTADMRSGTVLAILLWASLLPLGCARDVSDTGYEGTWQRTSDALSSISLRKEGQGYRFRWSLRDDVRSIRCDEQQLCEEVREGEKVYEYRFRVFERDNAVFVECTGTPIDARFPPLHYLDRLALEHGGLELLSTTVEQDGQKLDPPPAPLRFVKVSDRPF